MPWYDYKCSRNCGAEWDDFNHPDTIPDCPVCLIGFGVREKIYKTSFKVNGYNADNLYSREEK